MKGLIFTFVLTFGGSLAAQFRPYHGFLIYVAFAIIRPQALWWYSLPHFQYSRFIAIALLVGWVLHGLGSWRFGRAWGIILALIGFFVWMALGAFVHPYPEIGWDQVERSAKVFLPLVAGLTLIDSVAKLKQLVWVIVISQTLLAYEFHLLYYTTPLFIPEEWTFGALDRNGIAITMCTSIGLAFFLALHSVRWWAKLGAFISAILMAHVILFSMSRGGMLGLAVTGMMTFLLIRKRAIHYLIFFVALAIVLRLAGPGVRDRFLTAAVTEEKLDAAASSRVVQWKAMLQAMQDEPLFGVGTHMWVYIGSVRYTGHSVDGHSTWLTAGAELGVPALVFLMIFFGLGLVRLWPIARERYAVSDPWLLYLSRMVIASLAGFIVSGQFVTCYGVELPYYIMLIGAGILKLHALAQESKAQALSTVTASPDRAHSAYREMQMV